MNQQMYEISVPVRNMNVCFPSLEEMGYVRVVRCKDCKHQPRKHWICDEYEVVPPKNKEGKRDYTCLYTQEYIIPDNNFYCAYGERK